MKLTTVLLALLALTSVACEQVLTPDQKIKREIFHLKQSCLSQNGKAKVVLSDDKPKFVQCDFFNKGGWKLTIISSKKI